MMKSQKYIDIASEIAGVIEGEPSRVARYATVACLLSQAFDNFFWTGPVFDESGALAAVLDIDSTDFLGKFNFWV